MNIGTVCELVVAVNVQLDFSTGAQLAGSWCAVGMQLVYTQYVTVQSKSITVNVVSVQSAVLW